jgi:hypothetical protein
MVPPDLWIPYRNRSGVYFDTPVPFALLYSFGL